MKLTDTHYMDLALRMGRRHTGATAENPSVGCVVVKEGNLVSQGVTTRGGRPHAETRALAIADDQAKGADVYVTLEPCAHEGKTPPCCDALIAAGVRRVVTALQDPDPRTAGQGHQRLRDASIEVVTGVCAREARRDLAGFLSRIERGRPYVTLKLAVSSDGKIAARTGEQTAITGKASQRRSQMMRAQSDAIMVGAGTLRTDNPSLTCRLPGLVDRSPIRIVVCSDARVLQDTQLEKTSVDVPVWALCNTPAEFETIEYISPTVDLGQGLAALALRGIGRLLVEGGSELARSLLKVGLVDEIALFRARCLLGAEGVAAPLELITSDVFHERHTVPLGADQLTVYDRAR